MDAILLKLRDLLDDGYKPSSETQEYYGGAKIFTLSFANIDATTLVVKKNGTVWASANYSYSATTGQVTVTGTLATGDNLTFDYDAYQKWSTTSLRAYIRSALYNLAVEQYATFTARTDNIIFPTPVEKEECLIAIIAAILIKGNIKSYKTPEFSIVFDTDSMSVDKKIKTTVSKFRKAFGVLQYIDLSESMPEPEDN